MRKPEGVRCQDCGWWYWYIGSCTIHSMDGELGIDPMSPDSIEDCLYFEIKTHSEDESIQFTLDKLPSIETVKLVRKIRDEIYDDLIKRIKEGS